MATPEAENDTLACLDPPRLSYSLLKCLHSLSKGVKAVLQSRVASVWRLGGRVFVGARLFSVSAVRIAKRPVFTVKPFSGKELPLNLWSSGDHPDRGRQPIDSSLPGLEHTLDWRLSKVYTRSGFPVNTGWEAPTSKPTFVDTDRECKCDVRSKQTASSSHIWNDREPAASALEAKKRSTPR